MTKIALIPAFEPDGHMVPLLRQLDEAGFTCVVVNDGSGANYDHLFAEVPEDVHVLFYPQNHGKGYALRTGLEFIQSNFDNDAVMVTMDADGQHTVEDAEKCIAALQTHPDAIVLGCRSFKNNVPLRSRMGNDITRGVYRLVSGTGVKDTQTGLRAFGFAMLPFLLGLGGDRYEYEMNMLMMAPRNGIPFEQVFIATIYENGNKGSHFRTVRDSWRVYKVIFQDLFKFAGSSFVCFLTDYGLYSLLAFLTVHMGSASVILSNILARLGSSALNFTINRNLVFHDKQNVLKTAAQYFSLVVVILAGNTLLLDLMVNQAGWNRYASKIVTEVTFFTISWFVQKLVIFRKKKQAAASALPAGGAPKTL